VWLFSACLGHLFFFRALRQQREQLDQLTFKPLPSQTVPSPQLAEMYRYALFDVDVGPVTSHPRAQSAAAGGSEPASAQGAEGAPQPADPGDPMLSLGDVFVVVRPGNAEAGTNGASGDGERRAHEQPTKVTDRAQDSGLPELVMVINAQCDLTFAPEGSRQIEQARSILLLPGTLHAVREPIPDRYIDAPRTELYEHQGRSYRILWNTKEVRSVPYGQFRSWHDGGADQAGAEAPRRVRKARLRLPFALEVQRAFAADLTRVGMPVAPPIYQAVDIRLLGATNKIFDTREKLGDAEAAFLVLSRQGNKVLQQCVLTLPLVQRLKKMLEARSTMLRDQLQGGVGEQKEQLQARIDALHRAIGNHIEWAKLLSPIDVPTETKTRPLLAGYIQIVRNKSIGDESPTDKVVAGVSLQEIDG
jgi:hypothetical protein